MHFLQNFYRNNRTHFVYCIHDKVLWRNIEEWMLNEFVFNLIKCLSSLQIKTCIFRIYLFLLSSRIFLHPFTKKRQFRPLSSNINVLYKKNINYWKTVKITSSNLEKVVGLPSDLKEKLYDDISIQFRN